MVLGKITLQLCNIYMKKITSAIDELKYFLTYLKLLILLITVFYLINLSTMESVDWTLNGLKAIFATSYSMLNSMAPHSFIRKFCVVYPRDLSLVTYSFQSTCMIYVIFPMILYDLDLFVDDTNLFFSHNNILTLTNTINT